MIQFNLLPDVKMQYIKARHTQSLVVTVAAIVAAASLFILIVLFMVVNVLQKQHLNDVNKDIGKYTAQLNSNADLPKILTIQNQLKSLPNLMLQRPVTSRVFDYLPKIIPKNVTVSSLTIDFNQHTMVFSGGADGIQSINQFVDTLKFTTYTTDASNSSSGTDANAPKAFSNVVLSSFGRADKGANYNVSLSFDPTIFDGSKTPTLAVPNITSTRSTIDQPLFNQINTQPTGSQ